MEPSHRTRSIWANASDDLCKLCPRRCRCRHVNWIQPSQDMYVRDRIVMLDLLLFSPLTQRPAPSPNLDDPGELPHSVLRSMLRILSLARYTVSSRSHNIARIRRGKTVRIVSAHVVILRSAELTLPHDPQVLASPLIPAPHFGQLSLWELTMTVVDCMLTSCLLW
jgi:hypothetical protein